ncbi:MAG: hypothetical protein U0325_09575 [Polyangiales bacterium]
MDEPLVASRPAMTGPLLLLVVALVVAGVATRFAGTPEGREAPAPVRIVAATAGRGRAPHPGLVERREVWLHPAEDHIRPEDCNEIHAAWGAPDRRQFVAAMTRAGLDETTRDAVLGVTACDVDGCIAEPPDAVLASLTPAQRRGVYHAMRGFPQAMLLNAPFARPASRRPFWDDPGLTPVMREVLRAGSFVDGDMRRFSDLTWPCHRVPDTAGRATLFRTRRARAALDATVRVRTSDELNRAVRGGGAPGRDAGGRARLLASMRDGDAGVPLRDLLPPFARARLGTFPPRDSRFDCFWSALNFFSPTGEGGALLDANAFDANLAGWARVPLDQLRFGDVLVFRSEAGSTEHAVVYVADDLVISKDGWTMHRAWELVPIAREQALYYAAPRIEAYRAP